jgi:pyruvate formate lyase activating enzyme
MDNIKIFGKGWNFSQDGPGNRLLFHFQGCNLFCPWCSNPEGIAEQGTMLVNSEKLLDAVCRNGAVYNKTLNRKICAACTDRPCLHKHRNEGISWSAKEYSVEALAEEVETAKGLFHSGGGVTITGGEPTLQFGPLQHLLSRIKAMRVNTAIETNGTSSRLPELFERVDTLIIDFKHYDSEIHKKRLGLGNEKVIGNIRKAAESGTELWIRIPLIPDFNDSEEAMRQFINVITDFKPDNLSVELLPYHEYGKIKWKQAGMEYVMPNKQIAAETVKQYRELLDNHHINTINT